MKAQSNTQKSVRNQVSKMGLVRFAVIFSLVLIGYSGKAMNLKNQFLPSYTYAKLAMYLNEQHSESKKDDAANSEEIELALPIEEYNAKEFVDPEMDHEIENWMNNAIQTPDEDAVKESELQIQGYTAKEFSDADMALEIENRMANEKFIDEAEVITAREADAEIEKYTQKLILIQKNNSNPSVEFTDVKFLKSAEEETAQEAEMQVEKYASMEISQLQNEGENLIAGNENQN